MFKRSKILSSVVMLKTRNCKCSNGQCKRYTLRMVFPGKCRRPSTCMPLPKHFNKPTVIYAKNNRFSYWCSNWEFWSSRAWWTLNQSDQVWLLWKIWLLSAITGGDWNPGTNPFPYWWNYVSTSTLETVISLRSRDITVSAERSLDPNTFQKWWWY